MADKEEWNEVEVPETETKEEKVQYEVEGEQQEEVKASKEPEVKKKQPEVQEENPEELKGIETEGAQKKNKKTYSSKKRTRWADTTTHTTKWKLTKSN